eukprot:m.353084 g.353084  ORF g.353084 m.353084 type:complete len:182 (+) comp55919_c0_seq12:782-1327(+)
MRVSRWRWKKKQGLGGNLVASQTKSLLLNSCCVPRFAKPQPRKKLRARRAQDDEVGESGPLAKRRDERTTGPIISWELHEHDIDNDLASLAEKPLGAKKKSGSASALPEERKVDCYYSNDKFFFEGKAFERGAPVIIEWQDGSGIKDVYDSVLRAHATVRFRCVLGALILVVVRAAAMSSS